MRTYCVKGQPQAQGRARASYQGHNPMTGRAVIRHIDPEKSKSWKNLIGWSMVNQQPEMIAEGPIWFFASFRLRRPKSLKKSIQSHVTKPDQDNLQKAVKDALKGICWRDDSQVVLGIARKRYASPGDEGVTIYIGQGEGGPSEIVPVLFP